MKVADERGDDQLSSILRWHLCHTILLGGEGRPIQVAKILKLVEEVGFLVLLSVVFQFVQLMPSHAEMVCTVCGVA